MPELSKSIGWVTAALASDIPPQEKVLNTVVSGRFAQIGYLGGLWGQASRYDYARARRYLSQLGCAHLSEQEFATLSQGEQQRVLIARARMTKPYLIILDEPCAGMDPGARENFLASLRRVGAQRKIPALIYVTHHIEEILPLFRHTLVLRDGRVLYAGDTRRVLDQKCVEGSVRRVFNSHEAEGTLLARRQVIASSLTPFTNFSDPAMVVQIQSSPPRKRWWSLAVASLATLIVTADSGQLEYRAAFDH